MTKEEIIMEVKKIREYGYVDYTVQSQHAIDMAIKVLENERPKGHWLEVDSFESEKYSVTDMRCSRCGKYASVVLPHGTRCVYNFCPDCGADMRNEDCECDTDYEQAVTQLEHDMQYDSTYNLKDGSA